MGNRNHDPRSGCRNMAQRGRMPEMQRPEMQRPEMQRTGSEPEECQRRPQPDRNRLLREINECSFAVIDMQLYLDTHPCDEAALAYFMEHKNRRVAALKEYAKYYGPLTIDTADDEASESFRWVETPWPWEGGGC